MKRIFVYTDLIEELLKNEFENSDDLSRLIENEILKNPETGDIVQGTGGVRKFRVADETRGKGKRGGLRVLYLDLPHVAKVYLLFILKKGEADNIGTDDKKLIKQLVSKLKEESRP